MYEELIQRAKALDEKATPGPWMWDMRTKVHTCQLVTTHSGQYYVMQFSRWGMQDACPEFQQFKRYSGPVTERGGLGMVRADKMAKSYPGKEHHKGFDDYIDHPDAVFIAESRALVTELIDALSALRAENAELLTQHRTEHCEAAGYDCEELGRLMSANAEKDKAIERLKSELLEAREDYMASEMEREQGVAALSHVEAERDAAYNHICDQCDILPCLEDECPWWRGAQGEG